MRFFLGDDNGQLKSVRCTKPPDTDWRVDVSLLDDGGQQGKVKGIQELAVLGDKVVICRCDGTATLFSVEDSEDSVRVIQQWHETRFKPGERYVGLDITPDGRVLSCTTAGHLRLTQPSTEDSAGASQTTSLPSRLCEWKISDDCQSFAYGGDEVEISVWDTSRALDPSRPLVPIPVVGTKRKKGHKFEHFDGEIWRAQNVANDFLNLRQPVHNTSLTFLPHMSGRAVSSHHLLAGTRLGSVRRYDTRVARKPVADWKDIGKVGGVQKVQHGNLEYEAFIADHGSNLFALDLRTGRVLYTYTGLAGTISSLVATASAISPPLLASTSLDRFFRLHSTYVPGNESDGRKGEVLAKAWVKSAAGCVAWDGKLPTLANGPIEELDDDDHDVWAGMQDVGEESDTPGPSVDNGSDHEDREQNSTKRKKKKVQ